MPFLCIAKANTLRFGTACVNRNSFIRFESLAYGWLNWLYKRDTLDSRLAESCWVMLSLFMSRVIHILKPGLHLLLNLAWLVCCSLVVLAADIRFKARPGQLVRFCRLCVLHTNRQTCIWLPCLMSRDQRHLTASFKELPLLKQCKAW